MDDTFAEGLKAIQDREYLGSPAYREQQTRAQRDGVNPDIIAFERVFVKRMAKLYVPVFAHCVKRTEEEQTALYVLGRSKISGKNSPHVRGIACDIIHAKRAWDMPDKAWDLFGHIGKEVASAIGVPIEWGGDWSFYDPAHWQLAE